MNTEIFIILKCKEEVAELGFWTVVMPVHKSGQSVNKSLECVLSPRE